MAARREHRNWLRVRGEIAVGGSQRFCAVIGPPTASSRWRLSAYFLTQKEFAKLRLSPARIARNHLVFLGEKRYNAGFQKEDGTDMVDGVVDIPLPGMPLESGEENGHGAALRHFLAGPENRLVEVAVRSGH